jgi:micrococcal nuclease
MPKKATKPPDPAWLYRRRATVVEVTDGDTVVLMIDDGRDNYSREKMRLKGINTPEMDTENGKKAKAFLQSKLPKGSQVWIETVKDRREKYGRYLVCLYLSVEALELGENYSINYDLYSQGIADAYDGKGKVK